MSTLFSHALKRSSRRRTTRQSQAWYAINDLHDPTLIAPQAELERKKGVSGIIDAQEQLEKVSAIKSEIDESKGKTLEEISEMVEQLNEKIASKKDSLAPLIVDLRAMRTNASATEVCRG